MLTVTHQVNALVTAFLASLARFTMLAIVGIAVLQTFGIQTARLVAVPGATPWRLAWRSRARCAISQPKSCCPARENSRSPSRYRQERPADRIAQTVLLEMRNDPRLDVRSELAVHVSRVIDMTNMERPVVELTVTGKANPAETDGVRQEIMDRIGRLMGERAQQRSSGNRLG